MDQISNETGEVPFEEDAIARYVVLMAKIQYTARLEDRTPREPIFETHAKDTAPFEAQEIYISIETLSKGKALSCDLTPDEQFIKMKGTVAPVLTAFYNEILRTRCIRYFFSHSRLMYLIKNAQDKLTYSNLRPISITSPVVEILEGKSPKNYQQS